MNARQFVIQNDWLPHMIQRYVPARFEQPAMIVRLLRKGFCRPEAWSIMVRDALGSRGPVLENDIHLREAAAWILRAQEAGLDGGVSGGYCFEDGWIASYPETTGYIIPTLLGYADYAGDPVTRERALQMANWLLGCQLDNGAFPGHFVDRTNPPCVFNTGQIIFGLLAAYKVTGSTMFLDSAVQAAAWLIEVQDCDGAFRKFDYLGEVHSYNSRTAWALLELALATDHKEFLQGATRHLDWVANQQLKNGWFRYSAFSPEQDPFLHTIAYTVQGLLESGLRLGDKRYQKAAQLACDALVGHVSDAGFIPSTFDSDWRPTSNYSCLTGSAQMAVCWLRLFQTTQHAAYLEGAQRTLHFLKSLQDCWTRNPRIRGAIKGSHPIYGRYLFGTYPNWAAKFFMDALLLDETIRLGSHQWIRCW
ncbi:MAG: hypothetical protein DMG06_21760 [Acidobacteria bacterium]|nr:MAG: hypothetical protein DMG06_21760 [Acidobacteriota bacterium]